MSVGRERLLLTTCHRIPGPGVLFSASIDVIAARVLTSHEPSFSKRWVDFSVISLSTICSFNLFVSCMIELSEETGNIQVWIQFPHPP